MLEKTKLYAVCKYKPHSYGEIITFSRLLSKNRHPGKLPCTFLTTKVSTLIFVEGGKTLSRSLNDKIPNI